MRMLVRFFHRPCGGGERSLDEAKSVLRCAPEHLSPEDEEFLTLTPKHLQGKQTTFPGQRSRALDSDAVRELLETVTQHGTCALQISQQFQELMLIRGCVQVLERFHGIFLPWPREGASHLGLLVLEPTDQILEITPHFCISDLQRLFYFEATGKRLEPPPEVATLPHTMVAPPNNPHQPVPLRIGFSFHLVSIPVG